MKTTLIVIEAQHDDIPHRDRHWLVGKVEDFLRQLPSLGYTQITHSIVHAVEDRPIEDDLTAGPAGTDTDAEPEEPSEEVTEEVTEEEEPLPDDRLTRRAHEIATEAGLTLADLADVAPTTQSGRWGVDDVRSVLE